MLQPSHIRIRVYSVVNRLFVNIQMGICCSSSTESTCIFVYVKAQDATVSNVVHILFLISLHHSQALIHVDGKDRRCDNKEGTHSILS